MVDLADLEERSLTAAGEDLTLASDGELLAIVKSSAIIRSSIDAFEGHALAQLESRGVCDRDFGMATPTWTAYVTGGDRRVAATRTRVAVKLHGRFAEVG